MTMRVRAARSAPAWVVCAALAMPTWAQWPTDAATDLTIAAATGDQDLSLSGTTSDGKLWVGWFDNRTGNYNVRVNLIDTDGTKLFGTDGLLVSNNPQDTALYGWDFMVDSNDHAVMVFGDIRNGDLDNFAYRIAPDGTFVWGANGVTLPATSAFEPSPKITETADGNFVAAWNRDQAFVMQKVAADGTQLWGAGGVVVAGTEEVFERPVPQRSLGDTVIVVWQRYSGFFLTPRELYAQRYDADGNAVWVSPTTVLTPGQIPIAHQHQVLPDAAGGVIVSWHDDRTGEFGAYVQRLNVSGAALFTTNGLELSTRTSRYHLDPRVAYLPASDELVAFYREQNTLQSMSGISAQRISAGGGRAWGNEGVTIEALDGNDDSPAEVTAEGDRVIATWFEDVAATDTIGRATRVDDTGAQQWNGGAPVEFSSTLADKFRLQAAATAANVYVTWRDDRNGTGGDIFAKSILPDGTLGPPVLQPDPDFNDDGCINNIDLGILLAAYLACPGDPSYNPAVNLAGDDCINNLDLGELLAQYLNGCG